MLRILSVAFLGFGISSSALGQISITTTNFAYTENFNTLASTGTSSTVPSGWAFSELGSNANTTYTAGTGSSNAGETYSFGVANDSDRAFGTLQSGSLISTIGASYTNNTSETITSISISYDGELWRRGATNRTDVLQFQIGVSATSLTDNAAFTDFVDLNFVSSNGPAVAGGVTAPLEVKAITSTISGLNIASGQTFWIRWNDFNASGADDGMAIDNFVFIANPVPEPSTILAMSALGVSALGFILRRRSDGNDERSAKNCGD